jgi:hypothetical protein
MPVARDDQRRLLPPRFVQRREQTPEHPASNNRDGARRTGRPFGFGKNRVVTDGPARDELIHVLFLQIFDVCRTLRGKESGEAEIPSSAQGDARADKAVLPNDALHLCIHNIDHNHH